MLLDSLRRLLGAREATSAPATTEAPPDASSASPTGGDGAGASAGGSAAAAPADVQVAACVLLLELAWADGEFTDEERIAIAGALERHFGVTGDAASALLREAERELHAATDHFRITRRLVAGYDLPQRIVLAEVMWTVALADGSLADHEAYLVRKVANLLNVEPAYLSRSRNPGPGPRDADGP